MPLDLADFSGRHKIIVDTSSLMADDAEPFFKDALHPALKQAGSKIVVPLGVVREVEKHLTKGDARKKAAARQAERILAHLKNDGVAEIFGDTDDPFTDQTILYVVQKYRTKCDFLVVTQDSGLAESLVNIKDSAAVQSQKDLTIVRVDKNGIEHWRAPTGTVSVVPAKQRDRSPASTAAKPGLHPFALKAAPVTGRSVPQPISTVPQENDQVTTRTGHSYALGTAIAQGGEGTIYGLGGNRVGKIYHAGALTNRTLAKLDRMLSRPVDIAGVCWPQEMLFNQQGEPIGYLMRRAAGVPLDRSVFKKPLLIKHFPHWRRTDLVDVALSVTRVVQALHAINVILGDINPLNILVTEAKQVTFVDLDSAQIEEFPCPVGMINFTRAKNHGRDYGSYLRCFDDDKFALACLIFMILMPGKPPFSHAGGGDPGENIRSRSFPYRLYDPNERGKSSVPDGAWRFIWSHFSRQIKESFCRCFKDDQLLEASDWIAVLTRYRDSIAKGFMDQEQGNDIFPTRFRRLSDEEREKFRIAKPEETVDLTCSACGKIYEMKLSKLEERQHLNLPTDACPDCRKAFSLLKQDRLARGAVVRPTRSRGPAQQYSPNTVPPKRGRIIRWAVVALLLLVVLGRCMH